MKKATFQVILLLMGCLPAIAQQTKILPDKTVMKKNKVKTCTKEIVYYDKGVPSDKLYYRFVLYFDTLGALLNCDLYLNNKDTFPHIKILYFYNDKMQCVADSVIGIKSGKRDYVVYTYDKS